MLDFLYTAVSWVLLRWHDLFTLIGFSDASGLGWALSIVFLVITARLLLFRLFVKQVHYQRNMQKMQPKMQKVREKYKNDRAEMNRQMMKLQQEEGFNPLAGCLPMFLQIPVFIGLYHVLRHLANSQTSDLCPGGRPGTSKLLELYSFSPQETCHGAGADLFGAPLAGSFRDSSSVIQQLVNDPSASATHTRFIILPLLIISAAATFVTQLMVRANATTTPEGTAATIQRVMLYIIPLGVMASGLLFAFPLGVLLYWFTSNLWTLAQQAYIIRFHPPTDEPVKPVGEVGKTLAPKVGQRPARPPKSGGKPVSVSKALPDTTADDATATDPPAERGAAGQTARGAAPRPGQRPNRGQQRPPRKRPTQAKKRR
ncbi:YidC/Oxa1 family membrane protein insertase [Jatrophihabitans endophyticus]|uniref:Membrane protein insertase YidC n=1 Tax=Jatrophihabitans endophyticus TaxID=1206085 RepID=A0A1M5HVM8_9ACTN|nr:membrane protein insertase YidC [Jatrophihabitans endophyticus]SHG20021.1 YidC/Oxa1 family membrane protein insertase [Jatrophihabitans endophyticus]